MKQRIRWDVTRRKWRYVFMGRMMRPIDYKPEKISLLYLQPDKYPWARLGVYDTEKRESA